MKKLLLLVALVGGLSLLGSTKSAEAHEGYGSGYGGGYRGGYSGGYNGYRSGNFGGYQNWNSGYRSNYGFRPSYQSYQSYGYPSSCYSGYCDYGPSLYTPSCGGYGW
jgi:hypothetical protein